MQKRTSAHSSSPYGRLTTVNLSSVNSNYAISIMSTILIVASWVHLLIEIEEIWLLLDSNWPKEVLIVIATMGRGYQC